MLLSNRRITESILEMLERMQHRSDLPNDVAFELNVAATVLRHAQHVDISDGEDMRNFARQTVVLLQAMKRSEIVAACGDSTVSATLDIAIALAEDAATSALGGDAMKKNFTEFVTTLDKRFAQMVASAPEVAAPLLSSFAPQLLTLHTSLDLFGSQDVAGKAAAPYDFLSEANLTAYFRDKLSDPTAEARNVITLPGGFGKETTLFTVSGKSLNADLVMRRDTAVNPYGDLDCHIGPREYPVLKAVFARGFPAPEPLFFEAASTIIKGPPFTIMRRAPGKVAGDATGGQARVPAALQTTLAQVTARLHSVPPLTELAGIPAFETSLWHKTASECTRSNILATYEFFKATEHLPAPALHGLFNWLLMHVPDTDARPALIHGDIGFHNLLFDAGQLSAVLDWEFAHIGDPAEDLGYIRSVMGSQLDWPQFLADYGAAGRPIPNEERIRFFEVWANVRNATCITLISHHFETGELRDIKLSMIIYRYLPHFIGQAAALIASYGKD